MYDVPVNMDGLLSGRADIRSGYCPGWEMTVGLLSVGNVCRDYVLGEVSGRATVRTGV